VRPIEESHHYFKTLKYLFKVLLCTMFNVYNLAMFLVFNCNLLWYMETNESNKVEDGDQGQIHYLTQVYLLVR